MKKVTKKPAKLPAWRWDNNPIKESTFTLVNMGKVRDTYKAGFLVLVATDGLSAFDFCLGQPIPRKGEVLTALTHFWASHVLSDLPSHFVNLKKNTIMMKELDFDSRRSVAVYPADILAWELIFRAHIGGSVYKKYLETGLVAGVPVTPGLSKWSYLEGGAIFTPSTKSPDGHDVNITVAEYIAGAAEYGDNVGLAAQNLAADAYNRIYKYASERGILVLDTKLEVGLINGKITLCDELFTPDSSRFVEKTDAELAMKEGRDPQFMDKEAIRIVLKKLQTPFLDDKDHQLITGINKLDPTNPEHVAWVQGIQLNPELIESVTDTYLNIFERLTGMSLDDYQRIEMGIKN